MKTFILILFVIFVFAACVRYIESHSIFHPTKDVAVTPNFAGLSFEDVYFETKGNIKLNGWLVKAPGAKSTFLFLHGNAGNLSHRLEKILMFHRMGVDIFIIDYRGYGKSEGSPSEEGIYEDTLAAYEYLTVKNNIAPSKIVAYGDSLGGVAAVDLAARRPLAALIVDSSFSSAADISKEIFPVVPAFLLKTKMDSARKIKTVSIPKLFIHSINDEIIPFKLGKKLFEAAVPPKEFVQIAGGHNTNHIDSHDLFIGAITQFLRKLDLI